MPAGPARAADPLQESLLRRYAAADAGTVGIADGVSLLTEDPPSLWLRSRVRAPPAGYSVEPMASAAPDEAVSVADGDVSVEEAAPSDPGESGPTLFTAVRGFHSDPTGPADRRRPKKSLRSCTQASLSAHAVVAATAKRVCAEYQCAFGFATVRLAYTRTHTHLCAVHGAPLRACKGPPSVVLAAKAKSGARLGGGRSRSVGPRQLHTVANSEALRDELELVTFALSAQALGSLPPLAPSPGHHQPADSAPRDSCF